MTNTLKYIVVHHTAVSQTINPDQFDATNNYHKQMFGMQSSLGFWVGYNYEISANGTVRQARVDGEETAAQLGHNKDSLSICMDGNFDIEMPTQAQIDSLKKLCTEKMAQYNIPLENVFPHRYFATYTAEGAPFQANLSPYKTWDGCAPYKSCFGSKLPDTWLPGLLKPIPVVVPPITVIPVDCSAQIKVANNGLIQKIIVFLQSLIK